MVTDQVGNPAWCRMLAEITAQILALGNKHIREHTGLYHLADSGFVSRFDWAKLVLELDPDKIQQTLKEIIPALTADYPTPAQRPLFSALECTLFLATFGLQLPDWESVLRLALK